MRSDWSALEGRLKSGLRVPGVHMGFGKLRLLEGSVKMPKIFVSYRRKDQVHLLDLLGVGLIDSSWLPRLLPEHAARLQQLIDDPEG